MELFKIFIYISVLPSLAIYYFTNGNWPLAFQLQLYYSLFLCVAYIGVIIYSNKNKSPTTRGSNNIGAAGAIFIFCAIVWLIIIFTASLSLFYIKSPVGDPGVLNVFIEWGFYLAIIIYLSRIAGFFIKQNYIRYIVALPCAIKRPIIRRIMAFKELSYETSDQLEEVARFELQNVEQSRLLLDISSNTRFLFRILFENSNAKTINDLDPVVMANRLNVVNNVCAGYSASHGPSAEEMIDIINRLAKKKPQPVELLKIMIPCACEDANVIEKDKFDLAIIEDFELVQKVWSQYPVVRGAFYFTDGIKNIELYEMINDIESPIRDKDKHFGKLFFGYFRYCKYSSNPVKMSNPKPLFEYILKHYWDDLTINRSLFSKANYFADMFLFGQRWTLDIIKSYDFEEELWQKTYGYDDTDILNAYLLQVSEFILRDEKNYSAEEKEYLKVVEDTIRFAGTKGLKAKSYEEKHGITAEILKVKFNIVE